MYTLNIRKQFNHNFRKKKLNQQFVDVKCQQQKNIECCKSDLRTRTAHVHIQVLAHIALKDYIEKYI